MNCVTSDDQNPPPGQVKRENTQKIYIQKLREREQYWNAHLMHWRRQQILLFLFTLYLTKIIKYEYWLKKKINNHRDKFSGKMQITWRFLRRLRIRAKRRFSASRDYLEAEMSHIEKTVCFCLLCILHSFPPHLHLPLVGGGEEPICFSCIYRYVLLNSLYLPICPLWLFCFVLTINQVCNPSWCILLYNYA